MLKIINKSDNPVQYATDKSAGFDICSNETTVVKGGQRALVKTGLFIEFDQIEAFNAGKELMELQIRPRSGLALKHGITVLNSPGTVDADYPGEIGVILFNTTDREFQINVGDRIAQGVVVEVQRAANVFVAESTRTGGFGSTGQ